MTTIGEICGRDVVVATPGTTVTQAAKLMRDHHVGSLVIVDKMNGGFRTPLGIVTDRDLVVEVTARDLDPNAVTVGHIKPRELVTVEADESVLEALQLMRSKGLRRLPVVNGEGCLLGLIAFDDLIDIVTEQLSELSKVVSHGRAREAGRRK